jgi:endoglycosylceramidase
VSPTQLGWIHSDGHVLRDQYGRQWLGHGINARVFGLFDVTFTDGREPVETIPPFDQSDVQQMAQAGFNMLRLPINWSGLEPTEGEFQQSYLDRLTQVVGWCRDAGIYVLVDFHQDAWSKEIGEDGAPLWAIVPPPTMLLGGPLTDLTQRRESQQVLDASTSFFGDVASLQDRFVPAFTKVVSSLATEPAVIGYEPMNEPVTFQIGSDGEARLQAFYEKVATAFRTVDSRHALWLEPDSERNLTLMAPLRAAPFPDSNVVYEPHIYPTIVSVPDNTQAEWVAALQQSFEAITLEAASYGAAPFLGEWGEDPADPTQLPYLAAIQQLLEAQNMGEAFWLWKEESQGNWGFFDQQPDGMWTPRSAGLKAVATPYPMAVPGTLASFHFDSSAGALTVSFTAKGGEAAPLMFLPDTWYPHGVSATLNGQKITMGTGRSLVPWSGQSGHFVFEAK